MFGLLFKRNKFPSLLWVTFTFHLLLSLLNGVGYCFHASKRPTEQNNEHELGQLCADCRLTSQSIEELVRKPRQVDAYGLVGELIDLNKIKRTVCKELSNDQERERCRSFYFNHQEANEKWRSTNERQLGGGQLKSSYHDFVCIRETKYCCPSGSFGPKCSKCARCQTAEQHCQGEGTRAGNGSCVCKLGHSGPNCQSCSSGFYYDKEALKLPEYSSKRLLCKACDRSCKQCRTGGPMGCEVCATGFEWVQGFGCADVDECIKSGNKICGPNTFCVNTIGSYFCYECDRACRGCHGDGPDMCLRCADNYKLDKSGNCVALRKTILPPEANYYRYAIYVGLCVCTCIILHNSVYIASLIGLAVALYIGASEYVMSGQHTLRPEAMTTDNLARLSANPSLSHLGL